MQSDIIALVFFSACFFYVILMIIEVLLISNPSKWYYNHGILIYFNCGIIADNIIIPLKEDFIESLKTYKQYDKLKISMFEDNKYAIREIFFHYRFLEYLPIMRAILIINPVDRKFEIKGLLNYYTGPLVIFVLILASIFGIEFLIMAVPLAIILIIVSIFRYYIQSNRYSSIVEKLTKKNKN
jgi:hypothetical protein